jgi:hypothetical protein
MEPESVNKSPPLVPILSHINPIHTMPSYLSKIHFNTVFSITITYPKSPSKQARL